MRKRNVLCLTLLCLMALMLLSIPGGESGLVVARAEENTAVQAQMPFSCATEDGKGRPINGFWSEKDHRWYLFVTAGQEIPSVPVYFHGDVIAVSSGELDAENHVILGAFQRNGDNLNVTTGDGIVYSVVVLQSELPSVYIDLETTDLSTLHQDKNAKFKDNSVYLTDAKGNTLLSMEHNVEVKGRGNTTWRLYEKKAYQIKFEEKTSVLGMGKAKKWVIMANASDDSMMRAKLISEMAETLGMDYVASFEYVDLWVEGDYRGTYMIGEKVEIGSSRLDLREDTGALFEHDEDYYLEEDYWFFNKTTGKHFTMKEIVEEEDANVAAAMADFDASLDELMNYLYSTPPEQATIAELSTMIDVNSFARYYVINEYALNRESVSTSFYWYKDGASDVIHMGPIWDFDTCMGNDGEDYTQNYTHNHVVFRYLLACPEFRNRTEDLYQLYQRDLHGMTQNVDVIREKIASSAKMNYIRWDVLGKPNPKGGEDFYPTFDQAANALKTWLKGRETGFRVAQNRVVTCKVSQDCYEMALSYRDEGTYDNVVFALWSQDGGEDDLMWYPARQAADGTWHCTVDLGNHNTAGLYHVYAYANDQTQLLALGQGYVETARTARYSLNLDVTRDGKYLSIMLTDHTGSLRDVRFSAWGAMTGQAATQQDVTGAEEGDNRWSASIPLCGFGLTEADTIIVHAFGWDGSKDFQLNEAKRYLEAVDHTYADGETVCAVCGFGGEDSEHTVVTPMYRLYNPNSGEHFYTGSEAERDNLTEAGWQYEGVAWHAPVYNGIPVHRVYNPNSGDHHYTMSREEVDMLVGHGWQYEGICWNSAPEGSPQFRLWNPNADLGSHHYTGSPEERDYLVSLGWIFEGIGWFGICVGE